MDNSFEFQLPTKVMFGYGKSAELPQVLEQMNVNNLFIVTDKGIVQAGILESIVKQLKGKFSCYIFDEVEPDPSTDTVNQATEIYKQMESDAIVAIGGGSPIDTAKGIRTVVSNDGKIEDYAGVNLVKNKPKTPLVALPTTSGTGSEVTMFTVLSDRKEKRKVTVSSPYIATDVAIVDPKLTMSVPAHFTAASGYDALAHAFETFISRISQPPSEAMVLSAIKMINQHLRSVVFNGENKEARIKMSEASLLAGLAFNQSYLGLAHAIGSSVSGHANVSHGVAIGLLLPAVVDFNRVSQIEKYNQLYTYLNGTHSLSAIDASKLFVKVVGELRNDIGLPQKLREVNVDKELLEDISIDALKSGMWQFNPRRASEKEVLQILKNIY